jgi:Bacteriophage minor capsid protein
MDGGTDKGGIAVPILDDVGILLVNAGVGTLGTTLFLGSIPADGTVSPEDTIAAVIPIPGLPPVHVHNEPLASYQQPVFQIVTRSAPYGFAAAMARAEAALVALDGVRNQTVGGTCFLWITSLQSPWSLRTDDYNRYYLVFNVRCAVRAA